MHNLYSKRSNRNHSTIIIKVISTAEESNQLPEIVKLWVIIGIICGEKIRPFHMSRIGREIHRDSTHHSSFARPLFFCVVSVRQIDDNHQSLARCFSHIGKHRQLVVDKVNVRLHDVEQLVLPANLKHLLGRLEEPRIGSSLLFASVAHLLLNPQRTGQIREVVILQILRPLEEVEDARG